LQERNFEREKGMKKHRLRKRLTAALLSAAVVLGPAYSYAATFGTSVEQKNLNMTETVRLTNQSWYSTYLNDEIAENYVTYKPAGDVYPVVAYGNDIYGAAGFKTVIGYAQNAGQNVIAAINGDYFTMANGVATGMVIKEGIIRTSESSAYTTVGLYEDGSAIIGRSGLQVKAHYTDGSGTAVSNGMHLNKALTKVSGIVLYTEDYNNSNKATIPSYNVRLRITEGEPRINTVMRTEVVSVEEASGAVTLNAGEVVLSMASATEYVNTLAQLKSLQVGQEVDFTFDADEAWTDVAYAVGGGEKLLTNGQNVAPATNKTRAPRTAIGIKADGSVIFYTVDGRQSGYSKGTYLSELAGRLQELGCVEAVNMDGGGSTAMLAIYPGNSDTSVVNKPSEGALRSCGNYVLLVSTNGRSGYAEYLHLYPYSVTMLAGAKQEFTVKATDSGHYMAEVPSDLSFDAESASLGQFGADGGDNVFTAGSRADSGLVEVTGGGASGTAEVTIVESPSSVQLTNSSGTTISGSIAVGAGESYDFGAKAIYNRRTIVSQDDCYTWTVTGNIGTIDENGLFTASADAKSSGTVTVSAGSASASVTVNVAGRGVCVEDFEGKNSIVESGDFVTYTNEQLAYVHNGMKSLAMTYQFNGGQTLSAPVNKAFGSAPGAATFWLYGDRSGNEITMTVETESGEKTVSGGVIDFSGWKQIRIILPAQTKGLVSLNLNQKGTASGTLYLDHLMVTYGDYLDHTPPAVSLSVSGSTLTAHVTDNMDTTISKDDISVKLDGKDVAFTYDGNSVKASLNVGDQKTHRVSVTVTDVSGNVGRTAKTIDAKATQTAEDGTVLMTADGRPFVDTANHWSGLFDTYLYNQGIASGSKKGDLLYYQPNNNITRMEFAIIAVKWMGLDLDQYSGVQLNFADASQIPSWAAPYIKAACGSGMMSGSLTNGKLYFNPMKNVTRQEAMTVIGKTQVRGFAEAEMNFKDSDKIAAWALPYIKPLVAQGAISGSNGFLNPQAYLTRGQVASIIFGLN